MNKDQLVAKTRQILSDTVDAPYGNDQYLLVTEDEIVDYLDEGQEKFCRDTGFILDDGVIDASAASLITLVADTNTYSLHSSIIQVREVVYAGQQLLPATTIGHTLDTGTGICRYATDKNNTHIRIYGTPNSDTVAVDSNLYLNVWRYPLTTIASTGQPEILDQFHFALPHYAAYKIYGHADEELNNPREQQKQAQMFFAAVLDGKREVQRRSVYFTESMMGVGDLGWGGW